MSAVARESLVVARQQSLFPNSEAGILSFVRFIYTLECSLSKGISPRLLQWSICREGHSSISKTGSRVEVMWDTVFFFLNIETPPPANTQFPIRGGNKHTDSTEMVGGERKAKKRKENIEKKGVRVKCFILVAGIQRELFHSTFSYILTLRGFS